MALNRVCRHRFESAGMGPLRSPNANGRDAEIEKGLRSLIIIIHA